MLNSYYRSISFSHILLEMLLAAFPSLLGVNETIPVRLYRQHPYTEQEKVYTGTQRERSRQT